MRKFISTLSACPESCIPGKYKYRVNVARTSAWDLVSFCTQNSHLSLTKVSFRVPYNKHNMGREVPPTPLKVQNRRILSTSFQFNHTNLYLSRTENVSSEVWWTIGISVVVFHSSSHLGLEHECQTAPRNATVICTTCFVQLNDYFI